MAVSDNDSSAFEVMSTPLQGLKNKLKDLRRKSTHVKQEGGSDEKPFDRRATFGVSNLDTLNSRSTGFEQRGLSSAAPLSRFMPKLEKARASMHDNGMTEDALDNTSDMEGPESNNAEEDQFREGGSNSDSQNEEGIEEMSSRRSADEPEEQMLEANHDELVHEDVEGHSSADEIELRQVHSVQPNDELNNPATPMLKGLREMMRTPKAAPGTPRFAGMKEMFAARPELATPEMPGIVDLFPELVPSRRGTMEEEQSESTSASGTSASRLPTRNRGTGSAAKIATQTKSAARVATTAPRTRAKPATEVSSASKSTAPASSTGIRRARTTPVTEPVTLSAKPPVTRTRQAQQLVSSTSTEEPSEPAKRTTTRPVKTRTATAEAEEKPAAKATAKPATRTAAVRTRAKSAAPEPAPMEQEDGDADPLEDISVPEPDPEDIKPVRKATRTATATRTAGARLLGARSALPQPSTKAEKTDVEKPKTRTRAAPAPASRVLKSSTEAEEVAAPEPKRATRAAAGSRLTAPTASSKARATPPPPATVAPVRKTRAAAATIAEGSEGAESSGIPKRVTRARK